MSEALRTRLARDPVKSSTGERVRHLLHPRAKRVQMRPSSILSDATPSFSASLSPRNNRDRHEVCFFQEAPLSCQISSLHAPTKERELAEGNNEEPMHMAPDPYRYVLSLPATAPPGQEFFYNTGALTLVSAIVRKATGRPLDTFAHAVLFEPLGITGFEWIRAKGEDSRRRSSSAAPCSPLTPMPEADCACDHAIW
jgi:hypothetical protein